MAEKIEEIEKKEDEKDGGTTTNQGHRSESGTGESGTGDGTTGGRVGGTTGGTEGATGGKDSSGERGESGNSEGSRGDSKTERKSKLLERIRERNKRTSDASSSEHEGNQEFTERGSSTNDGGDNGNEGFNGNLDGHGSDTGLGNGSTTKGSASSNNRRGKNVRNNNEIVSGEDVGGVKFDSSDFKFKPQKPVEKPKNMGEVLNKKEALEMQAKLNEILRMVFTYSDKGIAATVKGNQAPVQIWSTITDSELSVISKAFVETGMTNKAVAQGIRTMAIQHNKVLIGVVMIPRFIQTAQLYIQNGFEMPKMGRTNV